MRTTATTSIDKRISTDTTPMPMTPRYDTDDARWQAVLASDTAADGQFVFAVRTTGVYCRPSCRGRQPLRRNVTFHDTPEQARAAGFRACKRCGGAPKGEADAGGRGIDAVTRACRYLDAADETPPSLEEIADAVGVSPFHLHRTFKKAMGVTPRQYWNSGRVRRLKANLKTGEGVAGALYGAGYGSSSRLYEKAKGLLGMTPASYGKGGTGAVIAWATRPTPLGLVLVGATSQGVCFVALGESRPALVDELSGDFPKAEIHEDPAGLGGMLDHVVRHLEGREPDVALPLDIRATAFQQQVWEQLVAIPYGETRTYAEIAAAIGKPQAPRAIGRACASNPVSLLVPCHRAIGTSGSLTGYRWGTHRKRALIDLERRVAEGD